MATDYDAPRHSGSDELGEESLPAFTAARGGAQTAVLDVDEPDLAESFELPGADLSGEELTVTVLPKQRDEFTCTACFLVVHRSRLAAERDGAAICRDCA